MAAGKYKYMDATIWYKLPVEYNIGFSMLRIF